MRVGGEVLLSDGCEVQAPVSPENLLCDSPNFFRTRGVDLIVSPSGRRKQGSAKLSREFRVL